MVEMNSMIMDAPITASAHTHMGTPPPGYDEEWMTHTIHVHGFASLSTERGESVASPEFMLPGGHANAAEGMTSLGLCNNSDKAIDIDFWCQCQ